MLYEIVIYVFPFILLLLVLVSFQLWKLEDTKEQMMHRLGNSTEVIEAARKEISAMRNGLVAANDSFNYYSTNYEGLSIVPESLASDSHNQKLLELGINVLNRVTELKTDSVDYRLKDFVITEPSGRYYAVVISYSELGYAIIQREHLISLGFNNIKILETNKLYALSIDDAPDKSDERLYQSLDKWDRIFDSKADGFIKKF